MLIIHTNPTTCCNHQQNADNASSYLREVKNYCVELCNSTNIERSKLLMEKQLEELFKVCELITPVTVIDPRNKNNVIQYKNLVSILRCSHEISLSNSKIVVQLLHLIMRIQLVDADDVRLIKHQPFGTSFLQFVFNHAEKENFDLQRHLSSHPKTFREFPNLFSIVDAIAKGDEERVVLLLSYGLPITLPQEERLSKDSLFVRSENLSEEEILVLEIMKKIEQQYMDNVENVIVSQEQKNCFELAIHWHPTLVIYGNELRHTLGKQHEHLLQQGSDKDKCDTEYRKLIRLVNMYVKQFCSLHKRTLPESGLKYMSKMQYGL